MKSDTEIQSSTITLKIKAGLKSAWQEIDELALQFSLGKADAADRFEEIKKQFNLKTHQWKQSFDNLLSISREKILVLKSKFEELQLQLDLGRAEAKDLFEDQRRRILNAISEIEDDIDAHPELKLHLHEFKSEIEKFKLKMDILMLKFELKKFEIRDDYKNEMKQAQFKIDALFKQVEAKWDDAKTKQIDFSEEITLAYYHLRKAVNTLSG